MPNLTRFTEFVARCKAWQIFVVLMVPMVIFQLYVVDEMPTGAGLGHAQELAAMGDFAQRMMIFTWVMMVITFAWQLSITRAANKRIKAPLRPTLRWYFAAMVYALVYVALAARVFPTLLTTEEGLPAEIMVAHMLAMAAIFYVLGFTAKNLVMAERQGPITFFDYSGALFLMWFFPVGVWFVQPRINRLATPPNS